MRIAISMAPQYSLHFIAKAGPKIGWIDIQTLGVEPHENLGQGGHAVTGFFSSWETGLGADGNKFKRAGIIITIIKPIQLMNV